MFSHTPLPPKTLFNVKPISTITLHVVIFLMILGKEHKRTQVHKVAHKCFLNHALLLSKDSAVKNRNCRRENNYLYLYCTTNNTTMICRIAQHIPSNPFAIPFTYFKTHKLTSTNLQPCEAQLSQTLYKSIPHQFITDDFRRFLDNPQALIRGLHWCIKPHT
jgi:hypothetical protein